MSEVLRYNTPSCGGVLEWSAASQQLVCTSCSSVFARSAFESPTQWEERETYHCDACGATVSCSEEVAATSCPYCGNNLVLTARVAGQNAPDAICPFTITREEALHQLDTWLSPITSLPDGFRERKPSEVQGVYVPFYLFDIKAVGADAHYRWSVRNVPVDASMRMPDDYMDSLGIYDQESLRPFHTAYLPGFLTTVPDVSIESCESRACNRKGSFDYVVGVERVGRQGETRYSRAVLPRHLIMGILY